MDLYSELKERGLIYQVSNEESVKDFFSKKNGSFYLGFDPTAKSLHVGNLLPIVFIKRLENAGFRPIVLVGGATGLIGDPSGKLQERSLTELKTVEKNAPKCSCPPNIPESILPTYIASTLEIEILACSKASKLASFTKELGDLSQSSPNFVVPTHKTSIFIFLN